MKKPVRIDKGYAAACLLALLAADARAAWEMTLEGYYGYTDASLAVCRTLMPAEVAAGALEVNARLDEEQAKLLQREQAVTRKDVKSGLAAMRAERRALRSSRKYQLAYTEEKRKLRALSPAQLRATCEWDWGRSRKHAAPAGVLEK